MKRSPIPRLKTWGLVALGFAAMLLLGMVVTVITLGSVGEIRSSVLSVTDEHIRRQELIEALRSQIYVSSILIRDFLLDDTRGGERVYADRLRESHARSLEHLDALSRLPGPVQSNPTLKLLASEVGAYWQSLAAVMEERIAGNGDNSFDNLRTNVIPRRQAVISLAEELADAGAIEARSSRQALNESLRGFRDDTIWLRVVTTILALGLAGFTTLRVLRLERAAGEEHARLEAAEAEMRRLSHEVLTSQEQERRSLSRELHDHVGQMVTALRFGLTDLHRQCENPTEQFDATIAHCRSMLEQTIDAIRGLSMGLRPTMLDDLGLGEALEWEAREFSRRFNIPVTVNIDRGMTHWPEPQRTALYRVTQEALTNCARHASAKSVRVDLLRSAEGVKLSVVDDGIGLPKGERRRGSGLLGIEERVREIGGRLNISSGPAGGTALEVQLPAPGVSANG